MRLRNEGAKAQRLLWASTGTKDPDASDVLYIEGLASPFTVNTMPEKTLKAFADHGKVGELLPIDGGDAEEVLKAFNDAGIDTDALATQAPGGRARRRSSKSWDELLGHDRRADALGRVGTVADIRLIAVPYELGRLRDGVGLGPERLLEHGAERGAGRAGRERRDRPLIELDEPDDNEIDTSFAVIGRLAEEVRSARDAGEFPVVLSGSCLAAVGVVAGLGEPAPGVVWLDAHGDFNEPETSVYGYLDGMGHGDSGRRRLAGARRAGPGVQPDRPSRRWCTPAAAPSTSPSWLGSRPRRSSSSTPPRSPTRPPSSRPWPRSTPSPSGLYLHVDLDVLDASVARVNRYAAPDGMTRPTALERVVRVLIDDRAGARRLADRLRARGSIRRAGCRRSPSGCSARSPNRGRRRHSSCKRHAFGADRLPSAMEGSGSIRVRSGATWS